MMPKPYLRDLRQAAIDLQKIIGEWVIAGIDANIPWPKVSQVVEFDGMDFILRASDDKVEPTIILNVKVHGINRKEGQDQILKLASALAWEGGGKVEIFTWGGGSYPHGIGKWNGKVIQEYLNAETLPHPAEDEAWIALALFREGISISNPFYSFLSFFKVISTIHRHGKNRQNWIKEALPAIDDKQASERLDELKVANIDISQYLFDEGRNAIAHAEKEIFVNPDRMIDYERIYKDLPIIRKLAELAIEQRYGIYQARSKRRPNRSLIAEFEASIGIELISMLTLDKPIEEGTNIDLPDKVSIVARRDANAIAYFELEPLAVIQIHHGIRICLANLGQNIACDLELDVVKHEMLFDPLQNLRREPDLSTSIGIDNEIQFINFQWRMVLNGRLEIWDESKNLLLGRTTPYVPVNMWADLEGHEKHIADLEALKAKLR